MKRQRGRAVIISAPSGAGKTTIVNYLLSSDLNLEFSVSATTRPAREGEIDGKDYHFLTVEEFKRKIERKEFLEWEEVYSNRYYGTLKSETENILKKGRNIIFDVDVKGGINLKNYFGTNALSIFIMPPSVDELKKRLEARGKDTPADIEKRVSKALKEMELADQFDLIIVNDRLENALNEAFHAVKSFLENKTQNHG
ncbi:MAG: guanylate kinase [Bacteroidales bacterium]|nr:guanylate kinase [Bacteroidales bacterium]